MECGQCSGYRPVQGGSRQGDKGGEKPFVLICNSLIYIYIYIWRNLKNKQEKIVNVSDKLLILQNIN